jgi:hypothetical protein
VDIGSHDGLAADSPAAGGHGRRQVGGQKVNRRVVVLGLSYFGVFGWNESRVIPG